MVSSEYESTAVYRRLLDIAAALNDAANIDEALAILAAPALEAGAQFASMIYVNAGDDGQLQALEFVAKAGDPTKGFAPGQRLGLRESAMLNRLVNDPTRTRFASSINAQTVPEKPTRRLLEGLGIGASILVPFYKQHEWIALAALHWSQPHDFSEELRMLYSHMPVLASPVVEVQRVRAELARVAGEQRQSLRSLTEALTQRTRTLNDILSAMPRQFVMIDRDGRVLYVNPATLEAFGVTEQQVIGQYWEDVHVLSEGELATVRQRIEQAFRSGEPVQFERTFDTTNGERVYEIAITPIHGEDGEMLAIAATTEDVTERRWAIERERDLAVERERKWVLTNIVRGAGHEFRNPLAVIRTKLYLLERIADAERRREHLAVLGEQVDAILYLVESLHIIALLEDPGNYDYDDVNIARLLERARWRHDAEINRQGHTVTIELDERTATVRGNETLLSQAIDQLCENAIKYTPQGGQITLATRTDTDSIAIDIRDNGPGIPPDKQAAVFEYFVWIEYPDVPRGQGLGLPLARKIARLHGGDITLESTNGAGSTFTLRLPRS